MYFININITAIIKNDFFINGFVTLISFNIEVIHDLKKKWRKLLVIFKTLFYHLGFTRGHHH